MTSGTKVTVSITITKAATSHYTQSLRTIAMCTAAASTQGDSTNSLGKEGLAVDHPHSVDGGLGRAEDGAAARGQHTEDTERT